MQFTVLCNNQYIFSSIQHMISNIHNMLKSWWKSQLNLLHWARNKKE